jgi:pimeloyl-ACP methyl ester carboxylesterase
MERKICWQWDGMTVTLGMEEAGNGPPLLLLPALSSVSTRAEMRCLLNQFAPNFHVVTVDWPGFGDLARPPADWTPDVLSGFLNWFLSDILPSPHGVVAAGHAATYALYQAVDRPNTTGRLVLISPTWRGPLPTMFGTYRSWFGRIRGAVDLAGIGPVLYRLNVNRFMVRRMGGEHVYSDPNWLSGDRLSAKLAVAHAQGARHASARFVTGCLDRVDSRPQFLDLVRNANKPVLVVYGDETPPRSRAEMDALAELPNVRMERLPKGKLSIHEEFPASVASIIRPFLMARRASLY